MTEIAFHFNAPDKLAYACRLLRKAVASGARVRHSLVMANTFVGGQITLENGYTVLGQSSCVDITNFDLDKGQKYSFDDAIRQIWPLEGYLLAEMMHLDRQLQASIDALNDELAPSTPS